MLEELRVRDLALIREARLELGGGLIVLTGETGAGKTALLGACKLLVGERGDAHLVRSGCDEARVEARFVLPASLESARGVAVEKGADGEEDATAVAVPEAATPPAAETPLPNSAALEATPPAAAEAVATAPPTALPVEPAAQIEQIAVRRLTRDGRSRCSLNDTMVTVGALARHIGPLVDLYGQHDHQSLLKASAQRAALDDFAGSEVAAALADYRAALAAWRHAHQERERLEDRARDAIAQREQADFALREIDAVNPQAGEYEALEEQLPRLRHAGELAEAARSVLAALREERGVIDVLSKAQQSLTRLGGVDARLGAFAATLDELEVTADELAGELRRYVEGLDFDPASLDAAVERLAALDGLTRRFGPRVADVLARREAASATLSETDNLDERLSQAEAAEREAAGRLDAAAAGLGELRREAAAVFSTRLTEAVRDLAMPDACFDVAVEELAREAWTNDGAQSVEIRYSPTAAQPPRPLAKIASGGELSRVMLAIKGLGHEEHSGMTLVFDEIDAGIGGAVALAVAARLRRLAASHQVLVVTHLAQIAAVADEHWLVVKQDHDGQALSSIRRVAGEERVDEIARMLAGSTDALAREHARLLLEEAQAAGDAGSALAAGDAAGDAGSAPAGRSAAGGAGAAPSRTKRSGNAPGRTKTAR